MITANPKFAALTFIDVIQPLSQLCNVRCNVELFKVGKQLSQEHCASSASKSQTQSALEATEEGVKALREVDRTTGEYVQLFWGLPDWLK